MAETPHTIVRFGDFTVEAALEPSPGSWRLVDFDDAAWYGIPEVVADVEKRPGSTPGTYRPLNPSLGPRFLRVLAEVRVDPTQDVREVYADTIASLSIDEEYEFQVEDVLGTRAVFASLTNVSFGLHEHPSIGRLLTEWRADDPTKFGPLVILTGSSGDAAAGGGLLFPIFGGTGFAEFTEDGGSNRVYVPNDGTAEWYPELLVPGPFESFEFSSQGRVIRFTRAVVDGQTVRVDTEEGMAWIGTSDVSGDLDVVEDKFFTIPPGGAYVQFAASGGDIPFTVQSRSAW